VRLVATALIDALSDAVPEPRGPLGVVAGPVPTRARRLGAAEVVVRPGCATDAEALVAMHARCSADVLLRRYRAPVGRLTREDAVSLLEPERGRSLVVVEGDDLVAAGLVAQDGDRLGLALHVEDDRQRRGLGARLLRALALEAASLGWEEVTCVGQPGDGALPATLRRAGLVVLAHYVDGSCHYRVPLRRLRPVAASERSGPSERSEVDDLLGQPAGR
jgi:GNAT superfamily N-acetyltransferase